MITQTQENPQTVLSLMVLPMSLRVHSSLFFGALALTNNYFGLKLVSQAVQYGYDKEAVTGQMANGALAVAHIGVGFLVAALVISFGGATGPALNPARDLMPRLPPHFANNSSW